MPYRWSSHRDNRPAEADLDARWVCRRDNAITLAYDELILRAEGGIPYVIPLVELLFKAKHRRPQDQNDFQNVLPALDTSRRARLRDWLSRVHPGHAWIDSLELSPRSGSANE